MIFCACLLAIWLLWLWSRIEWYKFSYSFPCIWGWPLLGSGLKFINFSNILPSIGAIFEASKRHTIALWMGLHLVILTAEPDFAEQVLCSDAMINRADAINKPSKDIFKAGLLVTSANAWHAQRKLLNTTFQHKVLISFFPIFNRVAKETGTKLQPLMGQGGIKMSDLLKQCIINGSLETTMGVRSTHNADVKTEVATYLSSMQYFIDKMQILSLLALMNLYGLTYFHKKMQQGKQFIYNFAQDIVLNKMRQVYVPNIDVDCTTDSDDLISIKKKPLIFIDEEIKLYKNGQLQLDELIGNTNGVIAAAFETSASTVLSTLIMLAMHPNYQQHLYDEIVQTFPDSNFEVEFKHLEQLPYLDMVINETLRLAPPIPLNSRQAIERTQLPDGTKLPKGLQVLISIYHLHRRTDIWGVNADLFDPDHFLPGLTQQRHAYSFMPFSKGARNCIGWRYAIYSIKIMIIQLIRNYRFTTEYKYADLRYSTHAVLTMNEEPLLELHKR